jgi:hypothetical protein
MHEAAVKGSRCSVMNFALDGGECNLQDQYREGLVTGSCNSKVCGIRAGKVAPSSDVPCPASQAEGTRSKDSWQFGTSFSREHCDPAAKTPRTSGLPEPTAWEAPPRLPLPHLGRPFRSAAGLRQSHRAYEVALSVVLNEVTALAVRAHCTGAYQRLPRSNAWKHARFACLSH